MQLDCGVRRLFSLALKLAIIQIVEQLFLFEADSLDMMNAATAPARLSARLISRRWATSQYGAAFLPTVRQGRSQSTSSNLPKIVQPSIWTSIIPKFMRNRGPRDPKKESPKSKEWNPATFFIMIFLLIGSQAIQILILKNDWATYSRKADAKVQLLKEVIERIKNGEKVDVEKLLGTGDEAKEREWEEGLSLVETRWNNLILIRFPCLSPPGN